MTEADKLRQERDQWKDEALRLREHLGNVCRALSGQCMDEKVTIGFFAHCVDGVRLMRAENEALRKRLESAQCFSFPDYWIERTPFKKWEIREAFGSCMICKCNASEPNHRVNKCYFNSFEEADAAALKALEVAG